MFTAFSISSDSSDELKEEIIKNSYVLPLDNFRNIPKAKVNSKSFCGKSSRSFYGCFECKLRKKKCDELKPSCSSCLKRKVECNYRSNAFRRRPNPSYPSRKTQIQVIYEYHVDKTMPTEDYIKNLDWESASLSPIEDVEIISGDNDLEHFLNSILSDFPYSRPEDLRSAIEISKVPVTKQPEITAMDESQIVQNISVNNKDDDDDLLLQFILNVKAHPGSISDEELSKYVTSGYDDFTIFKEILLSFLSGKYDHFDHLDELDRFYLASFCSAFADMCSFTSQYEESFCKVYYELAQHDDSVLYALISLGANYVSYQTSNRSQTSMKRSLELYGESLSKFVRQKKEMGELDCELSISIMINLIIYSQIGLLHGNTREWMQYQILLEKFVFNHYGGISKFVDMFKEKNPKLIKVITTFIFSHRVLTISNSPTCLSFDDMITGLQQSRTHYNEFDSTMGYCAGIYIQVARIKDMALKGSLDVENFKEIELMLISEQPNTDFHPNNDGFNEEDLELHLTFFEVQQISARLYLLLLSKNLEPTNEAVVDLLLNLLGSLQILLKTSFEAYFAFPLLMCRLTVSSTRHERVLQNIIAHVKSHNQVGNLLRLCMFVDELRKSNSDMDRNELYHKTLERLNWDISFCC